MDVDQLGMLKNKQNYIYEHFEWLRLDLHARNQCSRLISTLKLKSYYETCLCWVKFYFKGFLIDMEKLVLY